MSIAATEVTSLMGRLHPGADGRDMLLSIASFSVFVGFVCSCLAVWAFLRFRKYRAFATSSSCAADASVRFRDALLAHSSDAIVTFGDGETISDPKANALLQTGMQGADSKLLARLLDDLIKEGKPFQTKVRAPVVGTIVVRGTVIDGRAVLFLEDLRAEAQDVDYNAALDAIPVPVWVRRPDQTLAWANVSFLNAVSANTLHDAVESNASLEGLDDQLTLGVDQTTITARRIVGIGDKKLAFSLNLARLENGDIAGSAIDVTDMVREEIAGKLYIEASADMLDGLPIAIAVFGKDQRLNSYNKAYAQLWSLRREWLDSKPSMGEILDRLRETKHLPEQADFQTWKREKQSLFDDTSRNQEEFWHLPGGKSLRIELKPHLFGGIYMLVEDVSARLRLEASFKLLTQVQKATLDTIEDGIAIFGTDGRLILHNTTFATLWRLNEGELADQPHFAKIAILAESRLGQDSIWSIVSAGLSSSEPERCSEWGKATRADGRIISLSMVRLPNGATIVTFADLTDFDKFESLRHETPNAA